jgi:hypothetical protein
VWCVLTITQHRAFFLVTASTNGPALTSTSIEPENFACTNTSAQQVPTFHKSFHMSTRGTASRFKEMKALLPSLYPWSKRSTLTRFSSETVNLP